MTRLANAILWDFRLQYRFGFVLVGVIVTVFFVALLPTFVTADMGFAIPAAALGNLATTTYFFCAAMVLFEKGEGTLEALVTSPLREWEYLASKVVTLSILATVETLLIIALAYPGTVSWLPLIVAVSLMSATFVLLGFVLVARYDSITNFLLPSVGWLVAWLVPMLASIGLWENPIFYLFPTHAQLLLAQAAVRPVSGAELAYAVCYSLVSLAVFAHLARGAFRRFVVRGEGVH